MNIDLFRPSVPLLVNYIDYLKEIDAKLMYSNFGPMHNRFAERLAQHFSINSNQVDLFSSGTMAIVAALQSMKKEGRKYCILPSWTFVATPQAVIASGLEPVFVDVDIQSQQLTAEIINQLPKFILDNTSVVLVVSPFGAPLDLEGFAESSQLHGYEVLCDCAAGFDSIKEVEFPTVISLHATKPFGIGEGGALFSPNPELIADARAYSNFGFKGTRSSLILGVNGKLSEYHAAVGLAALELWSISRATYLNAALKYLQFQDHNHFKFQYGWGEKWITSTCVIEFVTKEQKTRAQDILKSFGIQTRDWWNQGCHLEPAFKKFSYLPQTHSTRHFASLTLGIPFYRDIDSSSISYLFEILSSAQ